VDGSQNQSSKSGGVLTKWLTRDPFPVVWVTCCLIVFPGLLALGEWRIAVPLVSVGCALFVGELAAIWAHRSHARKR
jgi:hypothetical protein